MRCSHDWTKMMSLYWYNLGPLVPRYIYRPFSQFSRRSTILFAPITVERTCKSLDAQCIPTLSIQSTLLASWRLACPLRAREQHSSVRAPPSPTQSEDRKPTQTLPRCTPDPWSKSVSSVPFWSRPTPTVSSTRAVAAPWRGAARASCGRCACARG